MRALTAATISSLIRALLLLHPSFPSTFRLPPTMNPSSSSGYRSNAAAFASTHQPRGGRGGGRRPGGRGGGGGGDGGNRIDALGRLLTRVLRHMAPELRLNMRSDGYVRVRDLLRLNLETFAKVPLNSHTVDEIREAVRRDNKQRFGLLEEDGELLIRANQGHTVTTVTSESLLKPILSADEVSVCVHGTYRKNVDSILKYGLKRMARLHVHFSSGLPSDGGVISGYAEWRKHIDIFECQKGTARRDEAIHLRQQGDTDGGLRRRRPRQVLREDRNLARTCTDTVPEVEDSPCEKGNQPRCNI
ncbi:unnamed protein product [Triticum turgidum subsp. durum]|uniref:2'-phosphotransferase n=1 Tax=Triticum turgidum subsp. durum TaxID=4567 RepID=A0A9R0W4Q8_TRITD|nr:unnamed protein product [Triticum turgidum subsp. durum]